MPVFNLDLVRYPLDVHLPPTPAVTTKESILRCQVEAKSLGETVFLTFCKVEDFIKQDSESTSHKEKYQKILQSVKCPKMKRQDHQERM